MAKEYWLQWVRYDDSHNKDDLPGGYTSLKDARKDAMAYAKVNHPIDIDGSDDIVVKFGREFYTLRYRRIGKTYTHIRIRILKDGSLSNVKPTKADIVPYSMMTWLNEEIPRK